MLKLSPLGGETHVSEGERKLGLLLDLGAMVAREVELDELLKVVGERVANALAADTAAAEPPELPPGTRDGSRGDGSR